MSVPPGEIVTKLLSRRDAIARSRDAVSIPGANIYGHLTRNSLSFVNMAEVHRKTRLNLVLPELSEGSFFAGIRTAVDFGILLAKQLEVGVQIVVLRDLPRGRHLTDLRSLLLTEYGDIASDLKVLNPRQMAREGVGSTDLWLVTHWTTAHAVDVACRLGQIDRNCVTYLVQDYEAGFSPWSTDYALARSTLYAGFRMVVNSKPLFDYIALNDAVSINERYIFSPRLDTDRIRRAAEARKSHHGDGELQIMFYGRPSKPRNLFDIGVSALHRAHSQLPKKYSQINYVSAGERHADVTSGAFNLHSLGKLSWDQYFAVLSESVVLLSLQHSPHPSHPPLDAICSGGISVTNEMGGTRRELHSRLIVELADPDLLAAGLLTALETARDRRPLGYDEEFLSKLGRPFEAVIVDVAQEILANSTVR
ncbi:MULTISPECIES: rhamnosyltransferase WsaF family glycosyltransferase [unclassified Rhodococcus (in: high G+C Gram-positive bacteria)]|uniref:rhamnosyltransferase WsaF family glycosyltransferase n=1 Tax=unclassified Rhodococcus (in: high G+C Gram-positive bacteria) TaxID=192944 RepID=UPI00117BA014|nr:MULTISPECIES: hypothetical protein [unclassified Rhodococcus (in: high G+C Gram-positive bacteria)]